MDIEPYYDRGALVKLTTHTVIENLLVGMGLVTRVLLHLPRSRARGAHHGDQHPARAAHRVHAASSATHTSANLISLGAVDFGIVVDSTVIMMENIFRHLGPHGKGTMIERIEQSAREVATPMTFSTLIIGVAFLPLFTMTGVSGVIFAPMARTYAFAIGGAILLALTLTPVLASKVIPAQAEEKDSVGHARARQRLQPDVRRWREARPKRARAVRARARSCCACSLFPVLGREFMPKLEEGNFWIRATLPMSISLDQSAKYVGRMRSILRGCPTDPNVAVRRRAPHAPGGRRRSSRSSAAPTTGRTSRASTTSSSSRRSSRSTSGRRGLTKDKLTDELNKELTEAFPGAVFNFSQMISDNVEEAVSGVKGENSVKVFGNDLESNEKIADAIVDVMGKVPGIKDLGHVPVDGAAEHQDHAEARRVRALRPEHRRRRRRHPGRHRRPGVDGGLRGREALRPDGAVEAAVPR